MTTSPDRLLSPQMLRSCPQLAALDLLIQAIQVCIEVLSAAHPVLEKAWPDEPPLPIDRVADRLIASALVVLNSTVHYRRLLLALEHIPTDDRDF